MTPYMIRLNDILRYAIGTRISRFRKDAAEVQLGSGERVGELRT